MSRQHLYNTRRRDTNDDRLNHVMVVSLYKMDALPFPQTATRHVHTLLTAPPFARRRHCLSSGQTRGWTGYCLIVITRWRHCSLRSSQDGGTVSHITQSLQTPSTAVKR